jgi:hypothetical protein
MLDPAPDGDVQTAAQALEASEIVAWDPATHGAEDLCPAGQGVTAAAVTLQPDPGTGGSTVLAVVTWHGTTQGKVFRVHTGAGEAAFRGAALAAHATVLDLTSGTGGATTNTGSTSGGPVPPPHPNV